ncbi:hypothetical protein [Bacillus sp. FJAT-49736]|uniref:hypothetical protein n=1 Tax=Bacillus sp. FJAT-49736 TaxID=2833582 RepID=UPI001BC9B437|nr:hypothetical protein [Bacillus sp. FJAT-49736]MBS4175849.1 hypothetical protein [Bacillus sp. FJAT-49736]
MKKITYHYFKAVHSINRLINNERGSQTLEWIGIAAVIIIVVGLVSTAFSGSTFGSDVVKKISDFLNKIGGGGGNSGGGATPTGN